ncbi:alpha/beta fold hydrolase [Sphingobium sp. CCH11-B1]|jgi:pimeloyl-ACP methyl ester carboxylesterase|uniref:alpha/beta fold hydrolase n=1 Tax=Sphingobium sp. CCH11-B1 TaxID=1768781 RepID=UPI0012E39F4C|nr:hypothetical protein [Sphingobium sp. CCH11-B1]
MAERVGQAAFVRQQRAILDRPESLETLRQIHVPTLVAVGDGDVLTPPEDSREIHHGITGSHFHLLTKCGHLPPVEQPSQTAQLLRDWLTDA